MINLGDGCCVFGGDYVVGDYDVEFLVLREICGVCGCNYF